MIIHFYWFDGIEFRENRSIFTTLSDVLRWKDECKADNQVCYVVIEHD